MSPVAYKEGLCYQVPSLKNRQSFWDLLHVSEHPAPALPVAGDHMVLARRYVGALLALAEQDKAVDAVAADMQALRDLWQTSPEWRFIATDPRWGVELAVKAAEQVAKISQIGKLAANFLCVVAQNRRLHLLPVLIEEFFEESARRRGEYRADIRTAQILSDAQKSTLAASLAAITGGKVRLSVTEDSSIIGGLTVKLGSQFIDASVKTKLDHLERSLKGAA